MINDLVKKFDVKASQSRCLKYRRRILDISQTVPALHGAGAFSAMEMMDCVYYGLLRETKNKELSDTFILSKGHSGMLQYVILEDLGILTKKDLDLYCKPEGKLGCHPDYGTPGIEASTGSLGHGMALAVGMAHADKIKKNDRRIYLILSDGELQEGSTWEAMMMAANLNTINISVLLDHNGSQSFGHTKETHPKFYPIKEKVEAFGWECVEVNGHDVNAVYNADLNRKGDKPFFLIGNTVKGKGVSFMEHKPMWHYRSPNKDEYIQAIEELKEIDS
jgi:transketolase